MKIVERLFGRRPAGPVLRPRGIDFDVVHEHDELATEQIRVWKATGTKAASSAYASAATASPLASGVRDVLDVALRRIHTTEAAWSEAVTRAQGFLPLTTAETRRYWATFVLLVSGDICGVTGAGIMLGEQPWVALLQAIGSGTAAVTSGLVAAELRKRQMAHLFGVDRPATVEDGPVPFTVFGLDPDDLVFRVAVALVASITVAVLAMRSVQGPAAALGFALLAFVTCGGSFINSWVHARPAAEILAGFRQSHEDAVATYLALAGHDAVSREAAALSEAGSIEAEHAARGEAARHQVLARLWKLMRKNPGVFGHGTHSPPAHEWVPVHHAPAEGRPSVQRNGARVHQPNLPPPTSTGRR